MPAVGQLVSLIFLFIFALPGGTHLKNFASYFLGNLTLDAQRGFISSCYGLSVFPSPPANLYVEAKVMVLGAGAFAGVTRS